jgi:hypothetical protein
MTTAAADQGAGATGSGLDHVFVIVMENHAYGQIVDNPKAPFTNQYARSANTADHYFAVAHPSLTNYLELVGGSNFGVLTDNSPDWHNAKCQPNIVSGVTATDNPPSPDVCPIASVGMDAETVAIDTTNEVSPPAITAVTNIDGASLPSARTVGKTIGDQLVQHGRTWKSYQESLPSFSPDGVNHSDGYFTDSSNIPKIIPGEKQTMIALYAVKHNPFAYFRNVQEGHDPANSLRNVVGFEGPRGLYDDLASGHVPDYAFIVPNQCNDQHGRGNAGPACDFDPTTTGTQEGLNPALIHQGDITLRTLVNAIHQSSAWHQGRNVIVVVWDENDYSATPNLNQVLVIVDTNYGTHGVHSDRRYTHFSLLKTIERGLGLPCLNHACDTDVPTMDDLF